MKKSSPPPPSFAQFSFSLTLSSTLVLAQLFSNRVNHNIQNLQDLHRSPLSVKPCSSEHWVLHLCSYTSLLLLLSPLGKFSISFLSSPPPVLSISSLFYAFHLHVYCFTACFSPFPPVVSVSIFVFISSPPNFANIVLFSTIFSPPIVATGLVAKHDSGLNIAQKKCYKIISLHPLSPSLLRASFTPTPHHIFSV